MEAINTSHASAMLQKTLTDALDKICSQSSKQVKPNGFNVADDMGACSMADGMMMGGINLDSIMGKVVNFNDMLGTAQDTLSLMRAQGQALLDLINRGHEEGHSQEEIDAMNAEAASRVSEINKLFEECNFDGINPLKQAFGVEVPEWQSVVEQVSGGEVSPKEAATNAITNVLADIDFNFDMSADFGGSSLNMIASANIKIGFTDDGALQIAVDASMDFDLSGVVEKGVQSDDSYDLVNNFLSLLDGKQNDASAASNFLNTILGFIGMSTDNFVTEDGSSSALKGKILQQATITLDNPGQMPNIAINLL